MTGNNDNTNNGGVSDIDANDDDKCDRNDNDSSDSVDNGNTNDNGNDDNIDDSVDNMTDKRLSIIMTARTIALMMMTVLWMRKCLGSRA